MKLFIFSNHIVKLQKGTYKKKQSLVSMTANMKQHLNLNKAANYFLEDFQWIMV